MKKIILIIRGFIILGTIIIIGTLFGRDLFIFDLFSHFYLQFFVFGVCLFVSTLYLKEKKYSVVSGVLLIFLGFNLFPVILEQVDILDRVDMYYINSNYHKYNQHEIIQDIEKYNPKYVAVVELNPVIKNALIQKFGIENSLIYEDGILSYGLFTQEEIFEYTRHEGNRYPFLHFRIQEGDFFLIHPFPPINSSYASFQKEHFGEVRDMFNTSREENTFILGDFNSSHYSRVFKEYFSDLHYRVLYSWNRGNILSIPIDYILGKNDSFKVQTNNSKISDHSPLLIQFEK